MPYLFNPPFKHDVFMSYAHGKGDNLTHWSRCLANELKGDILDLQVEFDDLDIFTDEGLDPTSPLTNQLRGKVQASGLLLVIMSNRYLQSAWCQDELEWFESEIKQCQNDGGLVLVVRAQPTEHDIWPTCLKDERGHVVLGFPFHPDNKNASEQVHPHGWPEPLRTDRAYFEELSKLATIVTSRLREIKEREALRAKSLEPSVHITIKGEPKIYLQAPFSLKEDWYTIKTTMEKAGCKVLPETLTDVGGDLKAMHEARKQRLQILSQEANAVCLLRPSQANGMDREIESIANDRSALQAFDKNVPCAILNHGDDDPPLAKELGIDTINAAGDNWLADFQGWLQHALKLEIKP